MVLGSLLKAKGLGYLLQLCSVGYLVLVPGSDKGKMNHDHSASSDDAGL